MRKNSTYLLPNIYSVMFMCLINDQTYPLMTDSNQRIAFLDQLLFFAQYRQLSLFPSPLILQFYLNIPGKLSVYDVLHEFSVWRRTGFNLEDIYRFGSHTGKRIIPMDLMNNFTWNKEAKLNFLPFLAEKIIIKL